MTQQLVRFPDAEAAMLAYLKPLWLERADDFRPTSFGNAFPKAAPVTGTTHLQLELDGTPVVERPALQRATVRFTLWAGPGQIDAAKNAQAITEALVDAHPGDSAVFSTRVLTGPLKGTDPTTKYPFVSFTARVNLRPQAL